MKTRSIGMITAAGLVAFAGTALALAQPQQPQSARQHIQLAQRLSSHDLDLSSAITTAETFSKGVAVAVRLSTSNDFMQRESDQYQQRGNRNFQNQPLSGRQQPHREPTDRIVTGAETRQPGERDTDANRQAQQRQDEANRRQTGDRDWQTNQRRQADTNWRQNSGESADTLYAIVTCVIDGGRVRDVIVDMTEDRALGYRSPDFGSNQYSSQGGNGYDNEQWNTNSMASPVMQVRATELMNATVRNNSGDRLGDIDDLAIDAENNRVVYGVLRRGGFLGMGQSRYAVSAGELSTLRNGRVFMNLTSDDFDGQSGFDDNKWPTRADPQWNTTWESDSSMGGTQQASRVTKASELIGTNVKSSDGKSFGDIDDLIVDTRTGRITYAIIECDRGSMAVPMAALNRRGDDYTLRMTIDQLQQKPVLDNSNDPDWNDARWNRRANDSFGTNVINRDTQYRDTNDPR